MNSRSTDSPVREKPKKETNAKASASKSKGRSNGALSVADYPLATKHPELIKTSSGKTLDDITLENVLNESVELQDMRITPEVLRYQAQIAQSAGLERLAMNLERAAELTAVPDDRVLEIYNALRPYRSSTEDLLSIADDLENTYHAKICADYVREAATLYQRRKKLKGND